jgi:molybdopterin/thiamine biosynthesis adenylyltransferase
MEIQRARSADLVDHDKAKDTSVAVIGLGAIGSNVVYVLSKMGIGHIFAYDDDKVEEVNIEPQVYNVSDVGKMKAFALHSYVVDPMRYYPLDIRWESSASPEAPNSIVVAGVDSMESRHTIATSLIKSQGWTHYIDGRMGGNIIEMYHVTPERIRDYYKEGIVGVEPMELPCSATAVAYNGLMCATYIARMVAAIINGQPLPEYVKIDLLGWSHQCVYR